MSTTYREGRAPVEHEGPTAPIAVDHTGKPLGEIVAVVVRKRSPGAKPAKTPKPKPAKRAKARRR